MAGLTDSQTRAIVWAQWRSIRNYRGGRTVRITFSGAVTALWYLMWVGLAVPVGLLCAEASSTATLFPLLAYGLLVAFLYWQLIPIFMASSGVSLDFRKLIVYPIPKRDLFQIEVILRLTSAVEMMIVLTGAAVGLCFNPVFPWWAALALLPFIIFNLLLSAGLRDLITRLFARRRVKEVFFLAVVLLAAAPQAIVQADIGASVKEYLRTPEHIYWPWAATAALATGTRIPAALAALAAWVGGGLAFARWQFDRSLTFDAAAVRAPKRESSTGWSDRLFRMPTALLPDPLGALTEKEIRSMARSPRFRLVFLMGFSFGPVIWLPMMLSSRSSASGYWEHYLTLLSIYAVLLLGEVCIFNVFGFDRAAVQVYYAMPVNFRAVIVAKNLAAIFWVALEVTLICGVGLLVRMPISALALAESVAVTMVFLTFLMSAGNILSLRNPRPVDPEQSWHRSTAGRVQGLLLALYPVISAPIALAYLARYAFDSELAFYAMIAFDATLAGIVYWIALDSALSASRERREEIITALSRQEGPMAA